MIYGKILKYRNMKIATGEGDDYKTGCFLDYIYFKNYYKMIVVDLSKQKALDADLKAIEQVNFTRNLDRAGNTRIYFILEEAKETVTRTCKSFVSAISFNAASLNAIPLNNLVFISIK